MRLVWDLLCALMIFYELIALPFEISFKVNISPELAILIDTSFLFDIVLNLNTGFYKNGILIRSHDLIWMNYLQS